jgi:2-aminoadipate transaminase
VHPRVTELQREAADNGDAIGLAGGLPATDLIPRDLLADALAEAMRGDEDAVQYGWPEGIRALREWIATRINARIERTTRHVDPRRVIITSGAQQALSLIAMVHRGTRIAVGDATYPSAIAAFERAGVTVVARAGVGQRDTHYLMPGCANPSGVDLVEPWRAYWLGLGPLIADEAYSELRFDGAIARPLLADAPDRVWHVGTLSKTLCPGLRVGWLVPPIRDHEELLQHKEAADLQAASITQVAAARLLQRLDYDAHLARVRAVYHDRAERLCDALAIELPDARFVEPNGGFAVWVELDDDGDDIALLEAAIEHGTSIDPGRLFRPRDAHGPVAFRASFSSAPIDRIAEGVQRLARAVEAWRARGRGNAMDAIKRGAAVTRRRS